MMVAAVATRTSTSLPSMVDRELAVLGAAALDDVHVRHDLDATDETRADRRGQVEDLLQRTVDAKAHAHDVLGGFDVHVRGAVAHRLGEDSVDDLDDRRVVGDDLGLGDVRLPRRREPSTDSNTWTSLLDVAEGLVVAVDRPADVAQRRDEQLARLAARLGAVAARNSSLGSATAIVRASSSCSRTGNAMYSRATLFGTSSSSGRIDRCHDVGSRLRIRRKRRGRWARACSRQDAHAHEHLAEKTAAALLHRERLAELGLGDQAACDELLAESLAPVVAGEVGAGSGAEPCADRTAGRATGGVGAPVILSRSCRDRPALRVS